ncbi:1108_t:CDS:1, partial [Ambispora leptoticha]
PSDVYAFGIIAYFLFTGEFPFRGNYGSGRKKVRGKVISGNWLKFQENVNLPSLLMELIKHCCDRDPSKRPTAFKLGVITEAWSMDIGS